MGSISIKDTMLSENLEYGVKIFRKHEMGIWLHGIEESIIQEQQKTRNLESFQLGKGIPTTPQRTDSQFCTRQPSWGTRENMGTKVVEGSL